MVAHDEESKKEAHVGSLVDRLAHSVIDRLKHAPEEGRRRKHVEAANRLHAAALENKPFEHDRILELMAEFHVTEADALESCIADAARQLGDEWENDATDFASVTRASARLFGLCQAIGETDDTLLTSGHSRSIMVATFNREDHVIGTRILTQRLRRKGHSVVLMPNASAKEVAQRLESGDFDCLMVSVATEAGLESAISSIKSIRHSIGRKVPVVLGGAVVELNDRSSQASEADMVTNDEDLALQKLTGATPVEGAAP